MSGKIRILYTIPNFDTAGSGKALLKIAQRLDRNRFDPYICCFHDEGKFFAEVKKSGIPVLIFQYTTPMIPRIRGFINAWKISRFFKKGNFDLIHSFHYSDDYSEGIAARLSGTKWLFTKKNMNWGDRSWKIRSKVASAIIAQNTDMIKDFFPGWKNVGLIGRGVDTAEFRPLNKSMDLLQALKLPNESKIVLTVANLVPVKGIEVLIDAFHKVDQTMECLYLLIVGDDTNEYADSLKKKAKVQGVSSKVIFTGKRLDVNRFHSITDVFVLPTLNKGRQEGSPVSLLEAMASGSVVLASNIAGIRDQLEKLPDQLFPPADSHALANKLSHYLSLDENERKTILQKQRQIIEDDFTIEREVKSHEKFYIQTVEKNFK